MAADPPVSTDFDPEQNRARFWEAWRSGRRPRLRDYLPPTGSPGYREAVRELIEIDLENRLCAWDAVVRDRLLENYFRDFSTVLGAVGQLELIAQEYQGRWERGELPFRAEYESRFPEHASTVRGLKVRANCPRCRTEDIEWDVEMVTSLPCPSCGRLLGLSELFPPASHPSAPGEPGGPVLPPPSPWRRATASGWATSVRCISSMTRS
jgi:hypothetical protein